MFRLAVSCNSRGWLALARASCSGGAQTAEVARAAAAAEAEAPTPPPARGSVPRACFSAPGSARSMASAAAGAISGSRGYVSASSASAAGDTAPARGDERGGDGGAGAPVREEYDFEDDLLGFEPEAWEAPAGVTLGVPRLAAPKSKTPVGLAGALDSIKESSKAKFKESIDISVRLGVDSKRSDQIVRGAASLPHGTGKHVRVAVFAEGLLAEEATAAGADLVGGVELIADIKENGSAAINFDKVIGTPALMPKMGAIARILGPRGLMPNPKLGTLTDDVAGAVQSLRKGRVEFRADRYGIVSASVGRVDFETAKLEGNIGAFINALVDAKPKAKGVADGGITSYLRSATVSTTMGKGIRVSVPALIDAARNSAGSSV
mmetsp:Transcript_13161/g.43401  ORF Transcript_13161/g.43401 Transcript_13161/m.43401 type:complete len:379 (-) Transcript_13161:731-1867(-)